MSKGHTSLQPVPLKITRHAVQLVTVVLGFQDEYDHACSRGMHAVLWNLEGCFQLPCICRMIRHLALTHP